MSPPRRRSSAREPNSQTSASSPKTSAAAARMASAWAFVRRVGGTSVAETRRSLAYRELGRQVEGPSRRGRRSYYLDVEGIAGLKADASLPGIRWRRRRPAGVRLART
jgi:hypothetical protein